MALVAGEISILLPKLHDLSKEEHILPRRVGREITSLIAKLENIQSALSRVSDADQRGDEQINLWTADARDLNNRIDRHISDFTTSSQQPLSAAIPSVDITAGINLKLKNRRTRRKFVEDIKSANRLVDEFVDRHERYRIDSGVLPFRPPRSSSAPDEVNGFWLEDMGTEMATVKELEVLEADKDHDYKLPRRVQEDMEFVKAELKIVAVVLQKIAGVPVGELDEVTEAWADGMKDVSRNIKRAVDNFKSAAYNFKRLGGKGTNLTVFSMKARRQFASEIRGSKRRLLEVAKRRQRYELRELRVPKLNSGHDLISAGTRLPDQSLVGIDEHIDALEELLVDEVVDTPKQQLTIASIIGVAGVGKTTLAKAVYSSRFAESFDCKAWVSLPTSTLPGMKGVLHDLLRQIEGVALVVMDEKGITDKICQSLQDKRYFIVIDDLWDLTAWSTMKHALIGNSNGSVVLTTSRRGEIVERGAVVYRLCPLSTRDSRKLFYKTLFHTEDRYPTDLIGISDKFIEKCNGIPATIISTAVLLGSKPWAVKEWYEVLDSVYCHDQSPNDTRRILDKCYNELPVHLKSCLLYLSLFPKGYEISIEQVVWQWIAEGRFIQGIQGETLQEVGESYLKELMKGKFLKPVEVDAEGKALSCSVYDLVHDLIVSKSSDEKFVTVVDGSNGIPLTDRVHRLSIQGNSSDLSPFKVTSSDLRTLTVYCDANANFLMPPLSSFQQLYVLDLGGFGSLQNDHLKGIENSFLLKYLAIGGNCITGLPKEIGRLNFLQTLDLRASGLRELPESIVLLRHLERLCVNSHMKIPASIAKMEGLKDLGDIYINRPELLKELLKLSKLKILRIVIWTWDESYNVALLEYLRSLVHDDRHQNIQSLSILTCCLLDFMNDLDEKWDPPSLQKLEIRESSFLRLPTWIGSLHNISFLTIEVHKLSQQMVEILGKLQNLCTLSLTSKSAPEGKFGIVPDGFKNLTSFKFVSSPMGQVFASEPKGMQMLKRLQLSFKALQTKYINQVFSFGIEYLCSLEHVCVEIICFNASRLVVDNAEAAIWDAISKGRSRCPILEMRRVREGDMIDSEEKEGEEEESQEKVVASSVKEDQLKETKKEKSSSWKIRVISKKFRQKKGRVSKKYGIHSLSVKSHILTLEAL